VYLPRLYWHDRRYRARVHWLTGWPRFHRVRDDFPEGSVWRLWLGKLIVVVMIDRRILLPPSTLPAIRAANARQKKG
jgi:hypothetical protein